MKRQPVKVTPGVFPQYVGQYEWRPGYMDTVTVCGGKLMAQLSDDDKPYELKPLNETTFFVDGDDDEGLTVFERGASGSVSRYYIARVAETSPRRKSSKSGGCGLAFLEELLKISGAGLGGASGVSTRTVFAGDVFRFNAVGEHQVWIADELIARSGDSRESVGLLRSRLVLHQARLR